MAVFYPRNIVLGLDFKTGPQVRPESWLELVPFSSPHVTIQVTLLEAKGRLATPGQES